MGERGENCSPLRRTAELPADFSFPEMSCNDPITPTSANFSSPCPQTERSEQSAVRTAWGGSRRLKPPNGSTETASSLCPALSRPQQYPNIGAMRRCSESHCPPSEHTRAQLETLTDRGMLCTQIPGLRAAVCHSCCSTPDGNSSMGTEAQHPELFNTAFP